MRALNLDFAKRSNPMRQAGVVMLFIALAVSAYVGKIYVDQTAELERWEARWHTLQRQQSKEAGAAPVNKIELEQLHAEIKAANRVIARLSLPWDALFREIETSVNPDVTLLNVEPDTEKREIRITAETKTFASMLEYGKTLQGSSLFKDAHIVSHQIQAQDPQRPVRFVVTAQWQQGE